MGKSWKVALALAIGYFLGRNHKTRLAFLLAAGAATGGGSAARRIVASGGKRLAASESLGKLSPDFGRVVDSLKGDLAEAGKAAAMAAVSSKLDSVADSIHDRTETLRSHAAAPDEMVSAVSRPEADRSSDQERPERPPRPRPSGESPAARPRSSDRDRARDRRPERVRRPAPSQARTESSGRGD